MPSDNKVSLQINLAPNDYLHAKEILPHVLDALSNQVDEILLIIDTRASKGRFAEGWDTHARQLDTFLNEVIVPVYTVKVIPVDYSKAMKTKIGQFFFGADDVPDKDFRGGPFYCYFFGLFTAGHKFVFHLDSDIFLGGRSQNWVKEAVDHFNQDPSCFLVSPLPGPPHPQGILIDQSVMLKISPYTFQLDGMSTRLFIIDKSRFANYKLKLTKPALRNQVKALLEGNPNAQLPEIIIADFMKAHTLKRIDFLGSAPGLWSLHPPYRTQTFYSGLKQLIKRIEGGDLPSAQKGFYDVTDEVCDWTEAKEKLTNNRWWKRYLPGNSIK